MNNIVSGDNAKRLYKKMAEQIESEVTTIIVKKSDIPHFSVNGEFGYIVGDTVGKVALYDCLVTEVNGDYVTLKMSK